MPDFGQELSIMLAHKETRDLARSVFMAAVEEDMENEQ